MNIKNLSKNLTISDNAQIASSVTERLFGLLNKKNSRYLIFYTHFGIHTFFMKEPIDIVLIDRDYKVIKIEEKLRPNHIFMYPPKYSTVIEMPDGSIKKHKINLKDKLHISR